MVSETINTKTAKGIEGNNCTIRHRVRRAFRRSCNFPKKLENHFKAFDLAFFGRAFRKLCHDKLKFHYSI